MGYARDTALCHAFIHRTEGLVDSFSQGLERSHSVSSSILRGIEPWLKNFHQLLLNPPKVNRAVRGVGWHGVEDRTEYGKQCALMLPFEVLAGKPLGRC
jgi:hypothetical protein